MLRWCSSENLRGFTGTPTVPWRFVFMEPLPKLNKQAARIIQHRLRHFWMALKAHFVSYAKDDLARAEERLRGRNEPPDAHVSKPFHQ
jgi:hypothetical protein